MILTSLPFPTPLSLPLLPLPLPLGEPQADAVDAMPLVRRRRVAFPLEHVAQVAPAPAAGDFGARHAERGVGVAGDGAGEGVEVGGPAAAGFELVRRAVEGRVAGGAFIGPLAGHVLVVLADVRRLGALAPDDAELLRRQHGLPFVLALLDRVVRHVFWGLPAESAEEGAEEGDAGHGPEEGRAVAVGKG